MLYIKSKNLAYLQSFLIFARAYKLLKKGEKYDKIMLSKIKDDSHEENIFTINR